MTLAAVLRHVLVLDRDSGSARSVGVALSASQQGATSLQEAPVASAHDVSIAVADEPALRRLNSVLNTTLDVCLQLDTARLQLQNAISTQREM
jgi:hypothetical protein